MDQNDEVERLRAGLRTPNASLPPLGDGPRREIAVTVSVPADWERRLDMQWVLEREIHADRWRWEWPASARARPLEWGQDSGHQWTDKHHGFAVLLEPGDELPYCASWGEGDSEQFATLEEAQAWCERELDGWVRRYVVVTPNRS